jgi:hypothetical protein
MDVLLTYDISIRHSEVKAAMLKKGYSDRWTASNIVYNMPNTSLWKKNVTAATAIADMKQVVQNLNTGQLIRNQIELERCVAVNFDDSAGWAAIPGKAHS